MRSVLRRWIIQIKEQEITLKGVLELTLAVFAIFGVIWAIFISLPSLKLQKWTAGKDFLQVCLSLDKASTRTTTCNQSIEAGPEPPPRWKRGEHEADESTTAYAESPIIFTSATFFTLAVVLLTVTVITTHPHMEIVRPVNSTAFGVSHGGSEACDPSKGLIASFLVPLRLTRRLYFKAVAESGNWLVRVAWEAPAIGEPTEALDAEGIATSTDRGVFDAYGIYGKGARFRRRAGVLFRSDSDEVELALDEDTAHPDPRWSLRYLRATKDVFSSMIPPEYSQALQILSRLQERLEVLKSSDSSADSSLDEELDSSFDALRMSFVAEPGSTASAQRL